MIKTISYITYKVRAKRHMDYWFNKLIVNKELFQQKDYNHFDLNNLNQHDEI